jgi:CheY-like chemotaxis protein
LGKSENCNMDPKIITPDHWEFNSTSFGLLMQKRIHRILVICSHYDFFMLEEDGRIDEQIYTEYVSLNLRFPPVFIQAETAAIAFEILERDQIDLVIEMLNIRDVDAFELAHRLKAKYPATPVVVLTHFSREVSLRLQNEDLSAVDRVFCWLGNADLLLAIIKLFEDSLNVEYDAGKIGVQTIMLVEDSVRYISSFLPNMYKIVLEQSRGFMVEGLNEHQKMLRMRGRPKILLATDYDEALSLYERYGHSMLGIISDVSYKKNRKSGESLMGVELARRVKADDPMMPVILQSSDPSNKKFAEELGVGFINKQSKSLSLDLRDYMVDKFAFGDFIFRDPDTRREISRATDLNTLQQQIAEIPDNVLEYHTSRNEVSKWLKARALFPLAQMFRQLQNPDFENLQQIREYIYEAIASFRRSKGRGIISKFDNKSFDKYQIFSRIGEGSLGGKARGLAFIDSFINKYGLFHAFDPVVVTIPRTVVIGTDLFDLFMESNDLYKLALSDASDDDILQGFVKAHLPKSLLEDLSSFLSVVKRPVAVRSSSKLEDSHFQPFAGIYSTVMVPNVCNEHDMLKLLANAIKTVYASAFYKASKAYMTATQNAIDEEKMGIILQEVCGRKYENLYYPVLSGVARSVNFYPVKPEQPADGIASIAYGLGKYIVDGGMSVRFSPRHPKRALLLSSPDIALRESQKIFYALNLDPQNYQPSTDDGSNLLKVPVKQAKEHRAMHFVASTFDSSNNIIRDGISDNGRLLVTFSRILQYNEFPLADILSKLLEIGEREMNNPVEIEFAVDMDTPPSKPRTFYVLQIRPIVVNEESGNNNIGEIEPSSCILFSESALGNGTYNDLSDIVYVRPETFKAADNKQLARDIELLNDRFKTEGRTFILIGPGRWGSSDPWLGIPVKWPQISEARIIVESGLENYRIDPSQGTHFFQNLTSFRVGYLTINAYKKEGLLDIDFLNLQPSYFETDQIRCVRFEKPLNVIIDGRLGKAAIFKPV